MKVPFSVMDNYCVYVGSWLEIWWVVFELWKFCYRLRVTGGGNLKVVSRFFVEEVRGGFKEIGNCYGGKLKLQPELQVGCGLFCNELRGVIEICIVWIPLQFEVWTTGLLRKGCILLKGWLCFGYVVVRLY